MELNMRLTAAAFSAGAGSTGGGAEVDGIT